MSKLNKKHLAFVDAYFLNGFNGKQAYLSVYKNVTDTAAEAAASRLLSTVKVAKEVADRQAVTAAKFEIKKEELMKDLLEIKNDCKKSFPPSAIKAIEVLNKMNGFDAPTKIEHSGELNIGLKIPGLDLDGNPE
jgi:phage terminase small subunit